MAAITGAQTQIRLHYSTGHGDKIASQYSGICPHVRAVALDSWLLSIGKNAIYVALDRWLLSIYKVNVMFKCLGLEIIKFCVDGCNNHGRFIQLLR